MQAMRYARTSARARGYDRDWERVRAYHLSGSPFCVYCKERGELVQAQVVDHIKPFRDDWSLRLDPANLQSLCKRCHDSTKQREERGSNRAVGVDGWPVNDMPLSHGIPFRLGHAKRPVVLVFGRPGSGKTTYVRHRMAPGDTVIDLDDITEAMFGERYIADWSKVKLALDQRDQMMRDLAQPSTATAWVILTGSTPAAREAWTQAFGPLARQVVLRESPEVCVQRVLADPARKGVTAAQVNVIDAWR